MQRNQWRTPSALTLQDLNALGAVVSGKKPLWIRTHRASDIAQIVRLAREEKIRLVLLGASEAWKVTHLLKDIPVAVSVDTVGPESFDSLLARADNAALLEKAGVEIAISTGSWMNNVRALRHHAGRAVAHGLSRNTALRAVTGTPAKLLGSSATLKKGAAANVVLWTGDPFEVTTYAKQVFIE